MKIITAILIWPLMVYFWLTTNLQGVILGTPQIEKMVVELGLKKEDFMVSTNACYDIFDRCYLSNYYSTQENERDFRSRVAALPIKDWELRALPGSEIFTTLNFHTPKNRRLTYFGSELADDRQSLPDFDSFVWENKMSSDSKGMSIRFFPISDLNGFEFANSELSKNVVMISYRYK